MFTRPSYTLPNALTQPGLAAQLFFQDDCCEKPLELAHKLKLYTDDDARHPQQSTKKPVSLLWQPSDASHCM